MEEINEKIADFITDKNELGDILEKYDLDESLESEFNSIEKLARELEVKYQSLINARRFLKNAAK